MDYLAVILALMIIWNQEQRIKQQGTYKDYWYNAYKDLRDIHALKIKQEGRG